MTVFFYFFSEYHHIEFEVEWENRPIPNVGDGITLLQIISDKDIEKIRKLNAREVFPYHEVDNVNLEVLFGTTEIITHVDGVVWRNKDVVELSMELGAKYKV